MMDTDSGGGQPGNSQDMSKRQGLISVNDLNYVLEPDLSVASNKTHKNHFFQSTEYSPSHSAICILNSGADYIDTRRSWLQFDVEMYAPAGVHASFGAHGSACNFIESILISTRSGDELCHLFNFNLMQNMLIPLAYGREWVDGPGQLMGFGGGIPSSNPVAKSRRLCIPMYVLAPLFGYGRLMPSMLMSGMRIEINWAKPSQAYQLFTTTKAMRPAAAATPSKTTFMDADSSYRIVNPQFVLSSIQLSDSIQRALNELSATNGLEIVYTDYAHTPFYGSNDLTVINTEIRKSCSRALKAFARVRSVGYNSVPFPLNTAGDAALPLVLDVTHPIPGGVPNGIGLESGNDSFRSERVFPFMEYQWQLGSLYFPQQPVSGGGGNDNVVTARRCSVSSYAHLLEAVDKFHDNAAVFNSFRGMVAGGGENTYYTRHVNDVIAEGDRGEGHGFNGSQTTIAVTLERSTMFNLAGVPVNNSRVLALRAKLTPDNTEYRTNYPGIQSEILKRSLDIFLKYVKLARVFLNNVEVEQ